MLDEVALANAIIESIQKVFKFRLSDVGAKKYSGCHLNNFEKELPYMVIRVAGA